MSLAGVSAPRPPVAGRCVRLAAGGRAPPRAGAAPTAAGAGTGSFLLPLRARARGLRRGGGGGGTLSPFHRLTVYRLSATNEARVVCCPAPPSGECGGGGGGGVGSGGCYREEAPAAAPAPGGDTQNGSLSGASGGVLSAEVLVLSAVLTNALCDAAFAYDGYAGIGVPDDEATPLQNAFGFVFTVFCGWYFLRVVKKRGNRATEFRVANQLPKEELEKRDAEQLARSKKLSPQEALFGGVTGLGIAFVLYGFAQTVSASFDGKAVPESYQARQITITVRTIVEGLCYLATFVYAANGTGLVALAAQKWLDKLTGVDLIDEAAAKLSAGSGAGGEAGGEDADEAVSAVRATDPDEEEKK